MQFVRSLDRCKIYLTLGYFSRAETFTSSSYRALRACYRRWNIGVRKCRDDNAMTRWFVRNLVRVQTLVFARIAAAVQVNRKISSNINYSSGSYNFRKENIDIMMILRIRQLFIKRTKTILCWQKSNRFNEANDSFLIIFLTEMQISK